MGFLIVLILAGITAFFLIGLYNSLVKLRQQTNEAWADIDTQLKRRYDLIPNLVETVKGYMTHEAETLEKVTQARNMAMNANSVKEQQDAENMLSGALKTIFALSENYPDLKANQNFLSLQGTLSEIEDYIQKSRRFYNGAVKNLNTKIEMFPSNIVANMFNFQKREYFEIENEEEKQNVKVSFSKEETPAPAQVQPETKAPSKPEQNTAKTE